jgi:small-conductance mechanosensitive channel
MANFTQTVKENPIKSFLGTAGLLIPVVGALFLLDARYAHAEDVNKALSNIQQSIDQSNANLRRQMLEDKLFELELRKAQSNKQQLNPIDQALKERYEQQIKDLNAKGNNQQH